MSNRLVAFTLPFYVKFMIYPSYFLLQWARVRRPGPAGVEQIIEPEENQLRQAFGWRAGPRHPRRLDCEQGIVLAWFRVT